MGLLRYSAIASLDGYIADEAGDFSWAAPDEELHGYVNDQERSATTYLLGRRTYEVMSVWDTMDVTDEPAVIADFASIWRAADKVVFSRSLPEPAAARTTLRRRFDPDEIRQLTADARGDLAIGGPTLAAAAARAGLIDVWDIYLLPILIGGGLSAFPEGVRLGLEATAHHHFGSGAVHLTYRSRGSAGG